MSTSTDWLKVLFNAALFTIGLLLWAYIRRRTQHTAPLRTIPRNKRFGVYLVTALLGFDFGLLSVFGMRLLHGGLLIVTVAANVGLAVVTFGFRLLRPLHTS
ncbi:MAG: hypothetical protein ACRD8A_02870 [Candidatus Acidiferrales bacterium]